MVGFGREMIVSADFFLLFLCFCCHVLSPAAVPTGPRTLASEEVAVLRKIDSKLKIGWDFNVDPCSGNNGWLDRASNSYKNRNLNCGSCDINNVCHVISILLKSQNLTGILPVELAKLTSLVQIDLTRNYINGSIPPEWGSLPLVNMSLGGNRISGCIPEEIGNISTLQSLVLENNMLQGPIPSGLGSLKKLTRLIISANDFTGELPESLGNLTYLMDFRIDGTGISGKIPDFIGNWKSLRRLLMQGTSLEGSFPSVFSTLQNLTELRISDLKGDGTFPPLENMNLKYLILRNCSISGTLPAYLGNMTNLKVLDLSFNNFNGEIPSTYVRLDSSIKKMYLTNNMFSGAIPDWILRSKEKIDLSYNFFKDFPVPSNCEQKQSLNVVASCSSSDNSLINPCLRRNFPCIGNATNNDLFINCGGKAVNIGGNQYEEDMRQAGASTFFLSYNKKWAFSSTGDFFGNSKAHHVATNTTILNMSNPEIYTTARLSPLSLKYHGLCLRKGIYRVNLHFAEIMFTDDQTFLSVGRRFFDVSIQGQKVLEDFNIVAEANGTGREIVKSFVATVEGSTLEIHFRWSGKGTSSIPTKGVYGPLISAISVTPWNGGGLLASSSSNSNSSSSSSTRLSLGPVSAIVVSSFVVILLLMLWFKRYYTVDMSKSKETKINFLEYPHEGWDTSSMLLVSRSCYSDGVRQNLIKSHAEARA